MDKSMAHSVPRANLVDSSKNLFRTVDGTVQVMVSVHEDFWLHNWHQSISLLASQHREVDKGCESIPGREMPWHTWQMLA